MSADFRTLDRLIIAQRRGIAWVVVTTLALTLIGVVTWLPVALAGWLVMGGIAVGAVMARPVVALYLLPLAVAFGSLAQVEVGGLRAGPADMLVGVFALALVLRQRRLSRLRFATIRSWTTGGVAAWRERWRSNRPTILLTGALLAYLAVIVASLLVATSKTATLKEIVKWSEVLVLLGLTFWLVRDARQVRWVVWAMVAAGVAEALLGYAQWVVASGDLGPGGANIRVFGTFAQPNPYAGYLNLALPLALTLTLFSEDSRERWVAGAASITLLGAEALANSRGGLLGLVAAIGVIAVVGWRRERTAALLAVVSIPLALVAWFAHLIPARLESAFLRQFRVNDLSIGGQVNSANFSTMERLAHWIAGLRMFAAHPLLGVGAGNYDAAYARYAVDLAEWPEPLGHAHNYYINVAAETGVLGLVAFLCVVGAMLYVGWRATHGPLGGAGGRIKGLRYQSTGFALVLGLFAVVVALTVHNVTDDLFVHSMELQLSAALGCLLCLRTAAT